MTPFGVSTAVFLGSLAGLFLVYPHWMAWPGVLVFAAFNAGYAWLVARVASMAWDFFYVAKRK